jgi:hypothetical protein
MLGLDILYLINSNFIVFLAHHHLASVVRCNTQISLQDTVIPYVPNSIGMLPKQASFLLLLVTLKSFYLPLSSHSVPVNPAKQEHVYPAAILFFVASVNHSLEMKYP